MPDGIDLEIAATLMTKGLTTNYLLTKTYKLKAGETVLFHAAAGGVGQIFAQWASSIGAKVIGTVGSDDKIKIAEENGYSYVINYTKDNFAKEVMKITNNKGVPAVFDGVGKNKCLDDIKNNEIILDIGVKTIENIEKKISQSNTVLWNGPAGYFENDNFSKGTMAIAESISKNTNEKSLISPPIGSIVRFPKIVSH